MKQPKTATSTSNNKWLLVIFSLFMWILKVPFNFRVCRLFTYFALDEITDNLVVEIFDLSPLDSFLHVFFLRSDTWIHTGIKILDTNWGYEPAWKKRTFTCSAFSVNSMKICCSFSLTKLMQNCSNPFFWRRDSTLNNTHCVIQRISSRLSHRAFCWCATYCSVMICILFWISRFILKPVFSFASCVFTPY